MTSQPNKILLTRPEAAAYVNLSTSTITRLEAAKLFAKRTDIVGSVRYRIKDLDDWVDKVANGEIKLDKKKPGRPRLAA
jgi:predicted DNA-binding transcriptional regulator AlpA